MAERKSVSMQDLADKLGISKVTVSKALNGKDGVGEELKEKIFALARESGYVLPDYGKRKSKKVGIIMSPRFSSGDEGKFYMAMYERIIYELQRASCSSIMISPTTATLPSDMNTIQTRGLFDGLIFLGILDKGVREQIAQIDLPKVYVDIYDRTHKSDSVITENIYSSYELTNYLIQQGHTDIGFVGTVGSTTSISDRYLGYLRRMLEEGISPKNEWRIPDRSEEGIAIPLLLPEKLPTAFVCNCDATAFKLVQALKERGICVPEDVSVTGFDDSIYAQLCSPSLTTVAVDTDAIARLAAKRMIKHMNEPQKKSGEVYRIPGKIIYRDSVCKINGSSDKPEQSGEGGSPYFMSKNGANFLLNLNYDDLSSGLPAIGVKYGDDSKTVVNPLDDEEILSNLDIVRKMYQEGIINGDAPTADDSSKYAMFFAAQGWSGAAKTTWGPNNGIANCSAVQYGNTVVSNTTVRGSINGIYSGCKHPDKALQLLNLVNTDSKVRDWFYYGAEGTDFEYTDDNKVHRLTTDWGMAGYTQGTFFNVTQTDDVDFNQWDEVEELNEKATPSEMLGFNLDTSNIETELANCRAVYEKYYSELFTGAQDPRELVKTIDAELETAGWETIREEAQKQIDAQK